MSTRTLIPGRSALRRPSSNKGLTLIELLVAMAIVGMIFAVGASSLRSVFNVNLKSTASRLSSTLRYLSDKAVIDHLYLRLIYDLDGQSYRAEGSKDPFVVSQGEEAEPKDEKAAGPKKEEGEEKTKQEKKEAGKGEGTEGSETPEVIKPTKLPSDVFFKDIQVSYLPQKKASGQATTYFFPDGYATATLINLKDEEDEDHYSVELSPLSGKVRVEGNYKESISEEPKK